MWFFLIFLIIISLISENKEVSITLLVMGLALISGNIFIVLGLGIVTYLILKNIHL